MPIIPIGAKSLTRIVPRLRLEVRRQRLRSACDEADGVTVGRRFRDEVGAERAARSSTIFYDDRLTKLVAVGSCAIILPGTSVPLPAG